MEKEKLDLQQDIDDLKLKLEQSYQHEDELNQIKHDLDQELYNKTEHINELTQKAK